MRTTALQDTGDSIVDVDYVKAAINSSNIDLKNLLTIKDPARVAAVGNIAGTYNSTGGLGGRGEFTGMPDIVDGIPVNLEDRVLLKAQASGDQNGVWVVKSVGTGADGVWERAEDFDKDEEVVANTFIWVSEGTVNEDTGWVIITDNPITIGGPSGTVIVWTKFTGSTVVAAGDGLTKVGNVISVLPDGTSVFVSPSGLKAAVPVSDDKDLFALATTMDGDLASNSPISRTPAGDGYVEVLINSITADLGDGVKTLECYFSGDGGVTARAIADITAGDLLYWNGSVAKYQLKANWIVDYNYNAVI